MFILLLVFSGLQASGGVINDYTVGLTFIEHTFLLHRELLRTWY